MIETAPHLAQCELSYLLAFTLGISFVGKLLTILLLFSVLCFERVISILEKKNFVSFTPYLFVPQ